MKKVRYNNISTSTGLLISKAKVPIYLMMKQALNLQKNAKVKRNEDKSNKGYIDFQNIGQEGLVNILNYRKDKSHVMQRPYDSERFQKYIEIINEFIEKEVPKNKLRSFYEILINKSYTIQEKNMQVLNLMFKIKEKAFIKLVWEEFKNNEEDIIFNKKQICSNILDIIELYDFIDKKDGE